jgi:lipopolysaccharide export system permease protein
VKLLSILFPSRTIAWYTARMFLVRVAAFIIGLTVILQSLDLLSESGKVLAAAGNTESDLWVYVSLRAPQIVQLFLPFSVLLATLVTLATLNQNSEVVIFKGAGLSAHHILAPLMVAALGVASAGVTHGGASQPADEKAGFSTHTPSGEMGAASAASPLAASVTSPYSRRQGSGME